MWNPKQATGEAILSVIIEEFGKHSVKPQKIMNLRSDGASVMTGTKTGILLHKKNIKKSTGSREFTKNKDV